MTPRHAQIALCVFLLLAAGVAINALFLQSRPTMASRAVIERPLPRATVDRPRPGTDVTAATRPAQRASAAAAQEIQRTARLVPDAAIVDVLPAAIPAPEDAETIRAIQRELRNRSYGALVSDGIMRPVTRAAIMAYEYDLGLPLLGEASEALLMRILLGTAAPTEASPAARKIASARAEAVVRTVQQLLTGLGYDTRGVDGRLGEDTIRSIREFEMDRSMPGKGRVSAEVLTRLMEATAAKSAGPR